MKCFIVFNLFDSLVWTAFNGLFYFGWRPPWSFLSFWNGIQNLLMNFIFPNAFLPHFLFPIILNPILFFPIKAQCLATNQVNNKCRLSKKVVNERIVMGAKKIEYLKKNDKINKKSNKAIALFCC